MKRILVVEDEQSISMVLKAYLQKAEYEVKQAFDGRQAMVIFEQWKPSLILLDVMLPDTDGWSLLRQIRDKSACPIIMLTALDDIQNRLVGLSGGADDYMGKPFIGEEVVARVQAVLRRQSQVISEDAAIFGSLKVDYQAREVRIGGQSVHLTPRDLDLLLFLTKHPNRSFDREQLIEHIWGFDYDGSDRAVDLSVKRIRQALAAWPAAEGGLITLRGLGYQFHVEKKA